MIPFARAIAACAGAMAMAASAAALPQSGATALRQGDAAAAKPIVTDVCAACHGMDGNSVDPDIPSLAGQGEHYLREQLTEFRAQSRNGVMGAVAAALSAADIRNLAAYFSQEIAKPGVATDAALVGVGEAIYRGGVPAHDVPACASCHSLDGEGLAPEFPRLAGQHVAYVTRQLRAFRSDARNSNPNAMMRVLAHKLSDANIDAVAQYIAVLHRRERD